MSKLVKLVVHLILSIAAVLSLIVFDWYRFATTAEVDPREGLYANPHLEVWIDTNARMPNSLRLWACETVRNRKKVALNGQNTMPFYSCQPDFGTATIAASTAGAILNAVTRGAAMMAAQRKASESQKTKMSACITDALAKAATPELRAALNSDKPDTATLVALNKAGADASKDCLAKAGL